MASDRPWTTLSTRAHNKIWRRTESTPRSGWWRIIRLESTPTACDTREINRHAILIRGVKNWWKNCHLVHCEGLPMKKIIGIHHFITILWYVFICVQLLFAHNMSFSYKSECPGEIWYLRLPCFCCAGQDDMICMSCTATSLAGHEGHSDGERVCLAAEGFGNRTCFLQSMANKVRFRRLSHFLPARRYASADTSDDPMSDCLCLCLSVHMSVSVTSHIVDSCPLSRFEGGLQQLHTADDSAVHWLETAAKKHSRNEMNKSVFYQNGWTNRAGFGLIATFNLSYTVL